MQRVERCCVRRIGACVCEKPFWFFRNFARLLAPSVSARMRNCFGATDATTRRSADRPNTNSSAKKTISVFQDAHTNVSPLPIYRSITIFEHDENIRSPMALGRILSDPDLRVGYSDVGISQSRRKGKLLETLLYLLIFIHYVCVYVLCKYECVHFLCKFIIRL